MKKLLMKTAVVCGVVLLLPFILTLIFTNKSNHNHSIETMNFNIINNMNGKSEKLDFEQYLTGVIAANMPAGYNMEALKAQAVIARTYALYNVSLLTEDNSGQNEFSTSELGLSYISLDEMKKFWGDEDYLTYFTKIENSVYGTRDEVMVYDGNLILPVFFDSCSGYTRNASEAWGIDLPYLTSVDSKQDVTSTRYLSISEYDVSELINILKQHYTELNLTEDSFFDDLKLTDRDSVGYVTKVDLGSQTVSGEEFAKVIGINSNNFTIENHDGKARIICMGVGHGIGLSQYGANAMADEGYSYTDILLHYYSGAELINLDSKS